MKKLFLSFLLFGLFTTDFLLAQDKCGFAYVMQDARAKGFKDDAFEAELARLIQQKIQGRLFFTGPVTIPVIFHVVYRNGNAEGAAGSPNLAQSQIQAQINQLNADYADLSGSTYPVATDVQIRFCAAIVNPNGGTLAQPGVDRINGQSMGWSNTNTMSQSTIVNYFASTIKPASIWDPYSYVNVWTCDMNASGLLGWATFPALSTLPGLDNTETDQTAGVVIAAGSVGSNSSPGYVPPYDLGKTLTHELGHFFGLRHIWGDGPCATDYCADTPPQDDATSGCPAPGTLNNCTPSGPKMFENYMDYSNDACLNTFTANQVLRCQTAMDNSPRRIQLINSAACQARPGNSIAFSSYKATVTETGSTGTCPVTKTITINLAVAVQATGPATVTFNLGGTAANNADYTISPAFVTYTAADNALKPVTITIIDDKAVEPLETVQISYTISGGSGVQAGPDKQTFFIDITDDDYSRVINNAIPAPALVNENFNSTANIPANWTVITLGGSNEWVVGANGGNGTTGNAAYPTEDATNKPNTYNEAIETDTYLITPLVDATGLVNLNVSFKWRCKGEGTTGSPADAGFIGYIRQDDPGTVNYFNSVFVNQAGANPAAQTFSGNLPASFNNSKFYFVFNWYNDNATGTDPGFTIDDVIITAQALSIESTLNDAVTLPQYTGQAVQYITADNQLVTNISNPNQNIGCITATIQNAGTGRTAVNTSTGSYFRTNKVIRISPAIPNTTATYQATLYFTTAELSPAWTSTEIQNLKILKVTDGVNLAGMLNSSNSQIITPTFSDQSASGYYAYTGNFTGFSQFMLASPNISLPIQLLSFEVKAVRKSIVLNWSTSQELNNKGFGIERSTDGTHFEKIGWVDGMMTTNSRTDYTFTDNFVQPGVIYYYQLRQTDIDLREKLSVIRQAKIDEGGVSLTVNPNPATDHVSLYISGASAPAEVALVNMQGQLVRKWSRVNAYSAPYNLNIRGLASGLYMLQVQLPDEKIVEKLLIR